MPSERFYVDADLSEGSQVSIVGTELHHLSHVMRVRIGEEVELVNGKGSLATGRLVSVDKKTAALEILSSTHTPIQPDRLILAIPLMRPAKLEWIIEKGTELGADAFWIYPAQFSDKDELSKNQTERLEHIAISAMKQCGRLDLPSIQLFNRFEGIFSSPYTYLFGDTRPNAPFLWEETLSNKPIVFIVGPEKGFSNNELTILSRKGRGVRLHSHILRAETAPLAALSILYSLFLKKPF